ncbi:MAG: DUF885 domain-containing protein [Verrucomicrobia bacterium]|nr:DUF885 domain-containing protein [Verrucomicrobiota bacterium]
MNATQRAFESLLDRHFSTALADNPVWANHTGLRAGEGRLGRATLSHLQRQQKRRCQTLAALDALNPRELSNEQHLDRLALRAMLNMECEEFSRGKHELEPGALDTVLNLLQHELLRSDDEPARARKNILGVLRATPRFLAEDAAVVTRPERVWRKVMQQTYGGAGSLFDAVDTFLARAGGSLSPARTAAARAASQTYHDTVMARPLAPEGSFAIGAEAMQRRVREQIGLDYTLAEIETLALGEAVRVRALLDAACRKFGKGRTVEEIISKARAGWNPGADLPAVYRAETKRVADGFRAAKAVTFPQGDELQVRLVPEFMRHLYPTAAYSSPGAFEKRQRGIFWVNDLSLTKTTEAEKLAERQQHFGLSLTAAHEAYPGHHLQFVTANRHPRKWRRLFAHAVFYEGWTLWCEQMMVDLRIDRTPWLRIQQLHDALWRVNRILVDLRLQTGRYSYEQAAAHLRKHLGFTKARSEAEINWYSASPTVPMSYWLGRLENERLRERLVVGRGWSLQQFNDWLLSFGTIPQAWIEKHGLE